MFTSYNLSSILAVYVRRVKPITNLIILLCIRKFDYNSDANNKMTFPPQKCSLSTQISEIQDSLLFLSPGTLPWSFCPHSSDYNYHPIIYFFVLKRTCQPLYSIFFHILSGKYMEHNTKNILWILNFYNVPWNSWIILTIL